MDKATDAAPPGGKLASKKKPRGPKLDVKRVSRQEVLRIDAPAGRASRDTKELARFVVSAQFAAPVH